MKSIVCFLIACFGLAMCRVKPAMACHGQTQPGVYLYEHRDYGGWCIGLGSTSVNNLVDFGFNDKVSSIRIIGDYSAIVFEHAGYGGWADTYRSNTTYVGDGYNDKISSVKVVPGTREKQPGVYLYEHDYYRGRFLHLAGDEYNLIRWGFDNITSSVRVIGEYRVTFYEHPNFSGARGTIRTTSYDSGEVCPQIWEYVSSSVGIYRPMRCFREFVSPQEIGNDMLSSVAITPISTYEHSSRLVWPRGMWIAASSTLGIGWLFNPNGTYSLSFLDSSGIMTEYRGNYQLEKYVMYPYLGGDYIMTFNNQVYRDGVYQGTDGNHNYRYMYANGGNAIQVQTDSGWGTHNFQPW